MSWMNLFCGFVAIRAVVPVWAGETLMTNTVNLLITTVTDGKMPEVLARFEQGFCEGSEQSVFSSWLEAMARVMSVVLLDVALKTQIIIGAGCTLHKLIIIKIFATAVASTS